MWVILLLSLNLVLEVIYKASIDNNIIEVYKDNCIRVYNNKSY